MSIIDLCASSIGTFFAEIITLPICTVKTNYQTNLNYKSIIPVAINIYIRRGIWGFYDSSCAAVASQVISTSSRFTFYNYIKKLRNTQQDDLFNNILNGAICGIISSIFLHPIDVVKIHIQNGQSFIKEFQKTGYSLLYRGYSKSFTKMLLNTSLILPTYDFYYSKFNDHVIAAALSSLTVTTVLHPVDLLKVRQIANQPLYLSFNDYYSKLKYYYRGLHINLMRVVPHFIITMVITEKIKKYYNSSSLS